MEGIMRNGRHSREWGRSSRHTPCAVSAIRATAVPFGNATILGCAAGGTRSVPATLPLHHANRSHAGYLGGQVGLVNHFHHQVDVLVGGGPFFGEAFPTVGA